ncbi:MAG: hypothetical protein ACMXX9_00325 [Candidatus Woesearchaeota archaeon]
MHKILDKLFGKTNYMDWQEYEKRVNFIDQFYWQQSVRQKSLKNT